jgi:glycosyltransferase involved in cell wall biosynthesis
MDGMKATSLEFDIECYGKVRHAERTPWIRRMTRAFQRRISYPDGMIVDEALESRVSQISNNFDLIWLSNLRMANSFSRWRWPHSLIDVDDLPSMYEKTLLKNGENFLERASAGFRIMKYKRREKLLGERFTVTAVCSEADRKYLGLNGSIHVIPNGFARPTTEPLRKPATSPRLGFIGQFNYPPNHQGIHWFTKHCWPRIKQEVPNARLRLIGRDTDGPRRPTAPDVDALAWLEDPAAEIASWSAMIVPVRTGAGTRVKIADAFSRKCPVISTTLGAFGYNVANGRELCLADSPAEFAEACVRLMRHPEEGAAMANRAWQRFLDEWTWEAITPRIWAAAEDCLRQSRN